MPLKLIFPKTKFILWSFDLYPEAYIAKKNLKKIFFLKPIIKLTKIAYKKYDKIVDIGLCMRKRLTNYGNNSFKTIIPWSIFEEKNIKKSFFNKKKISILYSGNLGEAHDISNLIKFIQLLGSYKKFKFYFSINNQKSIKLKKLFKSLKIDNAEFLNKTDNFIDRLKKFDIHLVTLKNNWDGIVVPSKFFSSLSLGKPVLYIGPASSSIYQNILDYDLGWAVDINNLEDQYNAFIDDFQNIEKIIKKSNNCSLVYNNFFSKEKCIKKWVSILKGKEQ